MQRIQVPRGEGSNPSSPTRRALVSELEGYNEPMSGPRRSWSDEQLREAVKTCITWGQVARALGLKHDSGTACYSIRRRAAELELDTSHFLGKSWNKGRGNGRDPEKVRAGKQRWYVANKQVYLDRNKKRLQERREKIAQIKRVPCVDCGGRFPSFVMDFDHRDGDGKLGNISGVLAVWSWTRILAEIEKCDVVCANCHRIRSARRAGWSEYDSGWVTASQP